MENEAPQVPDMGKVDLPFEVVVNGQAFGPGKGVEVPADMVDGMNELVAARKEAVRVQTTHQGAVKE